ncbi:MAG TPA: type II toxin-antitoxin system HicA family toxin [Candidatus Dormibacteraeota bacterium]|nr:type II toxin-antitoxin system HicA family toxin [Candidatus Dormibacteraeota bacterium]
MPKLPVVSGRELIKYLASKGFRPVRQRGSHVFLRSDGQYTTVPLENRIGPGLLLKILAQVGITREQFMKEWGA